MMPLHIGAQIALRLLQRLEQPAAPLPNVVVRPLLVNVEVEQLVSLRLDRIKVLLEARREGKQLSLLIDLFEDERALRKFEGKPRHVGSCETRAAGRRESDS